MSTPKWLISLVFILLLVQGIQWGILSQMSRFGSPLSSNQQEELDFSSAAEIIKKSVVGIVVTRYDSLSYGYFYDYFYDRFFDNQTRQTLREVRNMGSGFVIDSTGYILTSYHVVAGARDLSVAFPTGENYSGTLVGLDSLSDLAVVKVDALREVLHPASFANSDRLKVGQWVLAVGNPFLNFFNNADPTVTVGVVSALHRNFRHNRSFLY